MGDTSTKHLCDPILGWSGLALTGAVEADLC